MKVTIQLTKALEAIERAIGAAYKIHELLTSVDKSRLSIETREVLSNDIVISNYIMYIMRKIKDTLLTANTDQAARRLSKYRRRLAENSSSVKPVGHACEVCVEVIDEILYTHFGVAC